MYILYYLLVYDLYAIYAAGYRIPLDLQTAQKKYESGNQCFICLWFQLKRAMFAMPMLKQRKLRNRNPPIDLYLYLMDEYGKAINFIYIERDDADPI